MRAEATPQSVNASDSVLFTFLDFVFILLFIYFPVLLVLSATVF